jgi:ABC-type polysaccharide/polyol phosphate export permease
MKEEVSELFKYRELLYMIAYRDVKVRYKQSVMGFLWAILMPVLIVGAGVVVRYAYAMASGKHLEAGDIASVAVRSLPWAFLVSSIRFSCTSLINNQNLVTKVYFPKEVFPIAAVMASFFDFVIASAALVLFLAAIHVGWSAQLAWVPLLLLLMLLLAAGIAIIISAASLFFRDVKYIVEIFLTFGIFFTPVLYDVRMFGDKGKWLLLNPAAPILEGLAACVVRHQSPDLPWLAYSFTFCMFLLLGGYVFFKHLEPGFAESI